MAGAPDSVVVKGRRGVTSTVSGPIIVSEQSDAINMTAFIFSPLSDPSPRLI
jgi:hypothetical protein